MLVDEYPASLKCMPPHFSVESKVAETGVLCKLAISIPHLVLEVVANGDLFCHGDRNSASPVDSSVGKAHDVHPSMVNSLIVAKTLCLTWVQLTGVSALTS